MLSMPFKFVCTFRKSSVPHVLNYYRIFSTNLPEGVIRTPDERFSKISDYPFNCKYITINDTVRDLRMHYIDEGPADGEILLCLHGQPTWSYLYRKMIDPLTQAGYRVIAPDLIGFGKSDKLTARSEYTYAGHVLWMEEFIKAVGLSKITLVGQDWGGLIGLRLLAKDEELFSRVVISNTGLPDAKDVPKGMAKPLRAMLRNVPPLPPLETLQEMATNEFDTGFMYWIKHCDAYPEFRVSDIMALSLQRNEECAAEEAAIRLAYDAPFPSEEYLQGPRQFPSLVPIFPDDPAASANKRAWKALAKCEKPFLTCFTDCDPVTKGLHKRFQEEVPGAKGQKHAIISKAGHFVQEEAPAAFVKSIIDFCAENPIR